LPNLHSRDKTALKDQVVRAKSKWTPGGIVLWLIAAIVATLVVCSQSRPESGEPAVTDELEVEVEVVE